MTKLWAEKSCPKPNKCSILWSLILAILMIQREADGLGTLPDASQEGLLYQFKSYSNVALFHYNVPSEVTRATWEFAAFQDDPSCPSRKVHIYLQHGAYPVFNGYFEGNKNITREEFPPYFYVERTSLTHMTTNSAYQPTDSTVFPGTYHTIFLRMQTCLYKLYYHYHNYHNH